MRICVWGDCIHRFFLLCVGVDVGIDPYGPHCDCDIEKTPSGWMAFFHGNQRSFRSPAYWDVLKGIRTKLPANEHHGKVVDIRAGCAGDDEAIDLLERVVRVIVLQHVRRADAERADRCHKIGKIALAF